MKVSILLVVFMLIYVGFSVQVECYCHYVEADASNRFIKNCQLGSSHRCPDSRVV